MKFTPPDVHVGQRGLGLWPEWMFTAAWRQVLMIHLEVDPAELQKFVPFPLHLYHNAAFVTLVAFKMESMSPTSGGRIGTLLFHPVSSHEFLNVRTYVRVNGETGIHFLSEWVPNRISSILGPLVFGLPYKLGHLCYHVSEAAGRFEGSVVNPNNVDTLAFTAEWNPGSDLVPCKPATLDWWLMERYSAWGFRRFFRVRHPPWRQRKVEARLSCISLLSGRWPFLIDSRPAGASYSPGFGKVWMSRPHRCQPDSSVPPVRLRPWRESNPGQPGVSRS